MRISHSDRFWAKVSVRTEDECWEWQASRNVGGYGRFSVRSEMTPAHRFAYEDSKGPIPPGLEIDHLCRNRGCVNPGHLEAVSHRVNGDRGFSVPAVNSRKTHCKRGHEFTDENTYRWGTSRACRACRATMDRRRI